MTEQKKKTAEEIKQEVFETYAPTFEQIYKDVMKLREQALESGNGDHLHTYWMTVFGAYELSFDGIVIVTPVELKPTI